MQTKQKAYTIAAIGTLVLMLLFCWLLHVITLVAFAEEEDPGIEVAVVDEIEMPKPVVRPTTTGASAASPTIETHAAPAPPTPPAPQEEAITQEDEEALAMQRQQEEEKRKREEAIARANQMGSLFGGTGSKNTDPGATSSNGGTKGNPVPGKGTQGGNSWSLAGRGLVGSLPSPNKNFNQEGTVVVNIQVDKQGRVILAQVGQGSTISDKATQQLAVDAAYKAVFTVGDRDKAFGTITYHFKFN